VNLPRFLSFFESLSLPLLTKRIILHFIQNNWFTNNWIFLLLFLLGAVVLIAYIKNRKRLFQISSVGILLLSLVGFCFILLPQIKHSMAAQSSILTELGIGKSSEENLSAFSRFIDFIVTICKDKLRN